MSSDRLPARRFPVALADVAGLAAIVALGVAAYAGALDGPFLHDDQVFTDHLGRGGPAALLAAHPPGASRSLGYFSFALNHRLGGLDVFGYHLANLVIHLVGAALVYAWVRLAFRTPRLAGSSLAGAARAIALAAAALFVAHPLQTEAVTFVAQRFTSLATLFYLLAAVLYLRWRGAAGTPGGGRAAVAAYALALVSAVAAMKTKEIAFTLPVALLLQEVVLFGRPTLRRAATLAPFFATSLLVPLAWVRLDQPVAQVLSQAQSVTFVQTRLSRLDYLATQLTVIVEYLRLLVLPVGQNVDHDHPIRHGFASPAVLGSLLLLLALLAAAILLLRRPASGGRHDAAARVVGLGILWFFLALSVESTVIPIVDVMVEHRLYLPSAGLFAAVATGIALLARRLAPGRVAPVTAAAGLALASVLAVATHLRNEVWSSEIALWTDAAAKAPSKARPHYNLALALARASRDAEAIPEFLADLAIDPRHVEGYEDLALALQRVGRGADAELALLNATRIAPERPESQVALGTFYLSAGRAEEALPRLSRALELRPGYAAAYANAAGALNQLRRYEDAVRLVAEAPPAVRDNPHARFNAGVARAALGDLAGAAQEADALAGSDAALAARLRQYIAVRAAAAGR